MFATGHMLVGAIGCQLVGEPISGSFVSLGLHYLVDCGPTIGTKETHNSDWKAFGRIPRFHIIAAIDLTIGFGLLYLIVSTGPGTFLFWLGALVGIIPDFGYLTEIPALTRFPLVKLLNLPPLRQLEDFHNRLHRLWLVSRRSVLYWLYVAFFLGGLSFLLHLVSS